MKKGGMFAALVVGKKKPGMPMMGEDTEPDADSESGEDYGGLPPDFEDEAIKAFPELEGSPERLDALWKAMRACMEG